MTIRIGDYRLDASVSEEHSFDSEISEYPIESGSMVADHIQLKPIMVTVEFVVSDTPLGTMLTVRSGALALEEADLADQTLPSEEALAVILAMWQDRSPITIITALRTYDDMVIQSLSIPKDPETGHALRGTAKFKQIQIITNKRVVVKTADPRGQKKKKLGSRPSKFSLPPTVAWSCPPPIQATHNANTNTRNGCYLVRKRDGKYERVNGTPLTTNEQTEWNDALTHQYGIEIDEPSHITSSEGRALTRDPAKTQAAINDFGPSLESDDFADIIQSPFKF